MRTSSFKRLPLFFWCVFIKVCVAMPPKRNNRRTHMTEEEIDTLMNLPLACFRSDGVLAVQAKTEAQARKEADMEKKILMDRELAAREAGTHPVSRREEAWSVACELAAREAAAREAKAYKHLIEKWRMTNPLCFTHPSFL